MFPGQHHFDLPTQSVAYIHTCGSNMQPLRQANRLAIAMTCSDVSYIATYIMISSEHMLHC